MSTFQVPQFVDQESKVVGPLTLKQFLWLAGAAAISVFSFYTFTLFLWALITAVTVAIAIALAFVKIHGRELPAVIAAAFTYVWKPRIYTWKRGLPKEAWIDASSLERLETLRRKAKLQEQLQTVKNFIVTKARHSKSRVRGERQEERVETVRYMTGEEEQARRVDY